MKFSDDLPGFVRSTASLLLIAQCRRRAKNQAGCLGITNLRKRTPAVKATLEISEATASRREVGVLVHLETQKGSARGKMTFLDLAIAHMRWTIGTQNYTLILMRI